MFQCLLKRFSNDIMKTNINMKKTPMTYEEKEDKIMQIPRPPKVTAAFYVYNDNFFPWQTEYHYHK